MLAEMVAITAWRSGFSRAVLHATAVVTTLTFSFSGRTTTLSGAMFLSVEGTGAMPWPQPTKAIWEATERTSLRILGEKPLARQALMRLSKYCGLT
ncbi:hypothetical protein AZKH_1903 [Azoarcus sp. KH32C]|nr:hypothetical protein AZKH_1903 [Azoarcus sp. KH32C]